MSGLGAVQKKMTSTEMGLPGALRTVVDPLGSISPHQEQYREQQKQDQNARDLANQQAADASAAAQGPQSMAVRSQLFSGATNEAGGITASGNEADMAGTPLAGARKPRAARRVLVG